MMYLHLLSLIFLLFLPTFQADVAVISDGNANATDPTMYYVCGEEIQDPDCKCDDAGIMTCRQTGRSGKNFESANVLILKSNFTPKNVSFMNTEITGLQKDHVLPGREATIESFEIGSANLSFIENGVFDKFTSLKSLKFLFTNLTKIADEVLSEKLGSTLLEFYYSDYKAKPKIDFKNLKNLKSLELQHYNVLNYSTEIFPKVFGNLENLVLINCGIEHLNDDIFVNLLNLKTLNLYANPLTSFPTAISRLPSLQTLFLDRTSIKVLNNSMTHKTLEKLVMSSSSLSSIQDCAFCGFPNLKTLKFNSNHELTFIHENAFGYAYNGTSPKIESFSVEHCELQIIPEKLLNWHEVKEIGIGGNNFMCNCSMAWLINGIDNYNLTEIHSAEWQYRENNLKCSGPMALRDLHFSMISGNLCRDSTKLHHGDATTSVPPPTPVHFLFYFLCGVLFACVLFAFVALAVYHFVKHPKVLAPLNFENGNFE